MKLFLLFLVFVSTLHAAESKPGLLAGASDNELTVFWIARTPNFTATNNQSIHPQLKPNFKGEFTGHLTIPKPAEYQFYGPATLRIDGKLVTGQKIKLPAGQRRFNLPVTRVKAEPLNVLVEWESEGIPRQPIPGSAFTHDREPRELAENQSRDLGRELFENFSCSACHGESPTPYDTGIAIANPVKALPIRSLQPTQGCLSENPAPPAQDFKLTTTQREALQLFVQTPDISPSPAVDLQRNLRRHEGEVIATSPFNNPYGLAIAPGGALYVCDMGNHRIRKIATNGIITTVAGTGEKGWTGDGGLATSGTLNEPYEIRFDKEANIYFVEMRNHIVRRIDAKTGVISTIAGIGKPGVSGDGGAATNASLNQPHSIQFIGDQLWICDIGNNRLRAVDLKTGTINTVGGTGEKLPTKEDAPLLGNPLNGPRALDVAPDGTIWLALREGNAIYKIDPTTRHIQRAAGTGAQGFTGNSGPALQATLSGPKGITISPTGLVIWADTESHTIRYLDPKKNTVELLFGNGQRGLLNRPHGVFADAQNILWIGDSENHRVLRLKMPE